MQAINYFVANNYVKALEAIAKSPNQKILMMPLSLRRDRIAGRARRDHHERSAATVLLGIRRLGPRRAPGQRTADLNIGSADRPAFGETDDMQGLFAYFAGFGVWNWFILGVVLFVLEFMLPGRALPVVRPCRHRRRRLGADHRA